MIDPVSQGLDLLADGLRPYVSSRVREVLRAEMTDEIGPWDAQQLLLFVWDRWNELFRTQLTFIDRSIVSELREFRNRWAHQERLSDHDIYRVLDNIDRLLTSIDSPWQPEAARLRRESLHRLWQSDCSHMNQGGFARVFWPYLICSSSAAAISFALFVFLSSPWCWILSVLVFLATLRVAWVQTQREAVQGPGPRECTHCGRIVYSLDCPYCGRGAAGRTEPSPTAHHPAGVSVNPRPDLSAFRIVTETRPPAVSATHRNLHRKNRPLLTSGPNSGETRGESEIEQLRRQANDR